MELSLDLPRFRFDRSHLPAVSPLLPGRQVSKCLCHLLSLPSGIRNLRSRLSHSLGEPGSARRHGGGPLDIVPTENGQDRRNVAALPLSSLVPIPGDIDGTTSGRSIQRECNIFALLAECKMIISYRMASV